MKITYKSSHFPSKQFIFMNELVNFPIGNILHKYVGLPDYMYLNIIQPNVRLFNAFSELGLACIKMNYQSLNWI